MERPRISVLLPTFNCADYLRPTLESVKWADEILVVDSFSTDGTLDLCRQYGARIIQHQYINSARQKNWALPQCRHDWVLQIDSDEVMGPELREEIEKAVASAAPEVHAFRMPRVNHIIGVYPMRNAGLYPDYQVRLLRRDEGQWTDREVHAHVRVSGRIETLRSDLLHYGCPSLSREVRNLDRYTRYEADEYRKLDKTFHWYDLLLRPCAVFLHRYLWHQGFRDGWRGFIFCAYLAMYVFLARAKLWELRELQLEKSPGAAPPERIPAGKLLGSLSTK